MTKRYVAEWENLLFEKLVKLQVELGENLVKQESMLECLKYVEVRCMLRLIQGDDPSGAALRDFANKIVRSLYTTLTMMQEAAVNTLVEELIWDVMVIMLQKSLIKPTFEQYRKSFETDDIYSDTGNIPALLDGLKPVPDKYIGLSSHKIFGRLLRLSAMVHKTVPGALKWLTSGATLEEEMLSRTMSPFLVTVDGMKAMSMENVLKVTIEHS